ncbi:MAG: caspase domain-containing protein [Alloprevotella sp.]
MKRILLSILFVLLSTVPSLARTIYVVSVGICDYQHIRDLRKAENDAKAVAELYLTHTTHVTTLLGADATHDRILSTLRTVFSKASEDDTIVFFFSGHGSKGGLCAHDTKSAKTILTYGEVQRVIRACKAENKQLFIDACFSGGLRDHKKSSQATTARSPMSDTEGIMLFLSSRTGETSQENSWADNGFFTQYLVKGIKGAADSDGDRIITAKELFTFVSAKVSERTKKKQNPVMWGKFNDDMHIMNWNPKR